MKFIQAMLVNIMLCPLPYLVALEDEDSR